MNTYLIVLLTVVTVTLVVGVAVLTYRTVHALLRNRLRNKVLRSMAPWQRDNWNVTDWHQAMMMKLYDTKPEDRPIIVSIVRTEKGDGALACCHPKGWEGDGYNYAQGAGLDILRTISGAIALMELRGNKHCLNTLLVLLEQERERIEKMNTQKLQS